MRRLFWLLAVVFFSLSPSLAQESVVEAARKAREQKAQAPKAKRVLTEDDLRPPHLATGVAAQLAAPEAEAGAPAKKAVPKLREKSEIASGAEAEVEAERAQAEEVAKEGGEAPAEAPEGQKVTEEAPPAEKPAETGAGKGEGQAAAEETTKPAAPEKGEGYWRKRFAELRDKVALAERELDVLQREFNLSQQQYYSDPNQALREQNTRNELLNKQQQIDQKRHQIEALKQSISDLEDEMKRAGGSPGWARD